MCDAHSGVSGLRDRIFGELQMVGADDVGVQMRKQAERDQDIVYAPDAEAAKSVYLGGGAAGYILPRQASTGTMEDPAPYVVESQSVARGHCLLPEPHSTQG